MNWNINVLLDQQIVNSLYIFVLASIRSSYNGTDTNRVLIDQADGLLRIDHVSRVCNIDVLKSN
jgi:hypothetical protein